MMKKLFRIGIITCLLVAFVLPLVPAIPVSAQSWWNADWDYRVRIKFTNVASAENLINFPVLVHLDDTNIDWTHVQDAGQDIRFLDSNDSTMLSHEIEKWDDTNDAWIWVNVPQIDLGVNTDFMYMYFGNDVASDGQDAEGVWNSDYAAVWHMNQDPNGGGTILDSTSNDNDLTAHASMTSGDLVSGMIGDAIDFDGGDDILSIIDNAVLSITSDLSISLIAKVTNLTSTRSPLGKDDVNNERDYSVMFTTTGQQWFYTSSDGDGDPRRYKKSPADEVVAGVWQTHAMVFPTAEMNLYIDGADVGGTDTGVATTIHDGTGDLCIGAITAGTNHYIGIIDEVRITDGVRSADWIEAEDLTATESFLTFENVPVVLSDTPSGITSELATLEGTLVTMGSENTTYCYFQWGLTDAYGDNTTEQTKYFTGSFNQELSGLDSSETYHYRAAVRYDTDKYAYGEDKSFNTNAEGGWLTGYGYRQGFYLYRDSGSVSNYVMLMTINKGAGTSSGSTAYLGNHALSWTGTIPNDIRFTEADGVTELDYGILHSSTSSAKVAVEFDLIGTDPTRFYCYYGKVAAADNTDLSNVGLYGDDFNRANSDTVGEGWSEEGGNFDADIVSNQLKLTGCASSPPHYFKHDYTFNSDVILYIYAKAPVAYAGNNDAYCWGLTGDDPETGDDLWLLAIKRVEPDVTREIRSLDEDAWTNLRSWSPSTWYEFEYKYDHSEEMVEFFIDGVSEKGPVIGYEAAIWAGYGNQIACTAVNEAAVDFYTDSIFVRPWVDPEPLWGAWVGEGGESEPAVITGSVTGITDSSANLWGEITSTGDASVTERGFDYGTVYEDFTIVVLPDTQEYTYIPANEHFFGDQTQWIVDNVDVLNIKYVIHVGDIISHGDTVAEWVVADTAMDLLDGVVPYMVIPGNHDYIPLGEGDLSDRNLTLYEEYFGTSRFSGYDWYGGSYPAGSNANNYGFFSVNGEEFLVMGLEFCPQPSTVAWAKTILDANLDKHVIVVTHMYLMDDNTWVGPSDPKTAEDYTLGDDYDGVELWNNLIKLYSNIVLVPCGHVTAGDGVGRRVDYVNGEPVHQALACYQNYPDGGGGYLRSYTFELDDNEIETTTYSPSADTYKTDSQNQFTWDFRSSGSSFENFPWSATEVGSSFPIGTFQQTIYGLDLGVEYRYKAKAYNTEGWGYGITKTFTVTGEPAVPGAPPMFNAEATTTQINLLWTKGTGASNTYIRYATDTYPPIPGSGALLYNGTGTSTSLTTVTVGLTYYFSAWGESGGVYSVTYATALATPPAVEGEMPPPSIIRIDDVKIFSGYFETNDQLYVISYRIIYNEGTPIQDVSDYFDFQLLDGAVLKAQVPVKMWDYRPGCIYLRASSAPAWGGSYRVRIIGVPGKWETPPEAYRDLTPGDWQGSDLTQLDTWVISLAGSLQSFYDIEYVVRSGAIVVLSDEGGARFDMGIPGLSTVRPNLFSSIWTGIPLPEIEDYDPTVIDVRGRTGDYVYDIVENAAGFFDMEAKEFGGMFFGGGYLLLAIAVGVVLKNGLVGMGLASPVLILGAWFGLVPMALIAIAGGIFVMFALVYIWIRGT